MVFILNFQSLTRWQAGFCLMGNTQSIAFHPRLNSFFICRHISPYQLLQVSGFVDRLLIAQAFKVLGNVSVKSKVYCYFIIHRQYSN